MILLKSAGASSLRSCCSMRPRFSFRETYTVQRPSAPGWNLGSTAAVARVWLERVNTAQVFLMYASIGSGWGWGGGWTNAGTAEASRDSTARIVVLWEERRGIHRIGRECGDRRDPP